MLEATGALLDDEALDVLFDAAGLLVVELLTCEALELVADEALAGVLELTAELCFALEVVLEATDDFTDEAELDTFDAPVFADEVLADDFTDEVVLAGAFVDVSVFADVSVLVASAWLFADAFVDIPTLAAFRACSAVRDGCAATVPLPVKPR